MILTGAVLRTLLALYPNGCDVVEGRIEGHVHAQALVEHDGVWEPVNEYDEGPRSPFTHESSQRPDLKPCLVGGVLTGSSPPEAGCLGIFRDTYFNLPDGT